jgi:DNA-directed RNA polymerase subunit K/omega
MADTPEEKSVGAMIDELGSMLDQDADDDTPEDKPPKAAATGDETDDDDVVVDDEDDAGEDDDEEEGDDEESDADGEEGEEDEEVAPKKTVPKRKPKKKPVIIAEDDAEDEDDDDEDELPNDVMGHLDYLQTHHPEVIFPDSAEMQAILAAYTREEDPVKRKSRPILSKYEATSVVGMRSQQIVQGSAPLVDVPTDDPIEIAQAELKAKIIPVVVRRILPNGTPEYWRLSELRYYG